MYARLLCEQGAAQSKHDKLLPMGYGQYEVWSENACLARMEYLKKLTADDLREKYAER